MWRKLDTLGSIRKDYDRITAGGFRNAIKAVSETINDDQSGEFDRFSVVFARSSVSTAEDSKGKRWILLAKWNDRTFDLWKSGIKNEPIGNRLPSGARSSDLGGL
jgi:hypothetical protein